MKILWICGSCVMGGAEHTTTRLAVALRDRGHTFETLCSPHAPLCPKLEEAGLAVYPAPLGGTFNFSALFAIRKALVRIAPDVALVTTPDEWVWACLAKTRPCKTRLVLSRHMALPLPWTVRWLAARRADAVVAVSQAVRRSLLARPAIPDSRVRVIYNPARLSPRSTVPDAAERASARQALGLPPSGRWVGFFGGLRNAKGLRDVLDATRRANAEMNVTHLLVCGRVGKEYKGRPISELTGEFDLQDRLHHMGEIDNVQQALTACNVSVVATRSALSEALPTTLIESMACGTAVVGYASGGIPEVIGEDGVAGRLARPDDVEHLGRVLIELLADPAGARRMAINALERVRTLFDPQRSADQYEQLFSSLCSAAARS